MSLKKRPLEGFLRNVASGGSWRLGWTVEEARASSLRAGDQRQSATPGVYALLAGVSRRHGR